MSNPPSEWARAITRTIVDASLSERGTKRLRLDIALAIDQARATGFREAATCNGSTPYPLIDVLRILANAADHLHDAHNCDAHGYEVIREATNAAREIIHELTAKLQPPKPATAKEPT